MQNPKLSRAKPVLKYFGVLLLGAVMGGALVFYLGWGVMAKLMGVEAQTGYRAVERSVAAYDTVRVLSHLRLGENKEAVAQAERQLDFYTIESAAAAKEVQDAKVKNVVGTHLKMVKRYRKVYPSQTDIKAQATQVLAAIPALPESKQKLPNHKLTALGRLYQRHQTHSR
jgi:hypothetical protein